MATKGVLGNDPFQRGAAQRPTESQPSPARAPEKAAAPKKAKASGVKAAAKKARPEKGSGKAAKTQKSSKARKPGRGASVSEQEAHRLREPGAPETPHRRPPARVPVVGDSPGATLPRTPKEQEVDRVLATAAASEASEAAAEAAAEVAVETMLALQAQQASAVGAAPPGELEQAWNRELATAVVAEAAEAAAEAVLASALLAVSASADLAAEPLIMEERATIGVPYEEGEIPPSSFSAGVTVIDRAYSESGEEFDEQPDEEPDEEANEVPVGVAASARVEPEQELQDTERDEYAPRSEPALSMVPPSADREPPQEPFFTDQVQGAAPDTSEPRASGVLSLAKEIAFQALANASVGKALGTAQGLLGAMSAGLGISGSTSLDEYGRDSELVDGLQPLLDFLYERYWRVSVQGADAIPSGGAILVANHSGALPYDGLVAALALLRERPDLREPRWLVEDQVFHAPVLGTLFNRLGAVRACPENAVRLLDEQRPVLVFPEGYQGLSKPFAQRYQLKRFGRGGFVKLALRTGAPIIPVSIVGSEETSPLLGRIPAGFLGVPYVPLTSPMPLPARWTLRFGDPIGMEGLGPDAADDLAEVQRLTERTREAIMGMLQALLRERRSVFAG
ncbi:lysophospholipid acyltransferase family protein [Hyalangium minutum]|uniref:Acyltransferase family protein n=1 Tax=Hyalangium minutum TaxID=394096 RepID=A0A085WSG6_9BACT|nr:lysophospholipid acyltransferase family protein [Hyalangium minutum]KFE70629.1 acyltransferase family protein [Hyalangium minutum]